MVRLTEKGWYHLLYQDGAITGAELVSEVVEDFGNQCWTSYPTYDEDYGWDEEAVLVDEQGWEMFRNIRNSHDLLMAIPAMFLRTYGETAYKAFKIEPYMVQEAVAKGFLAFA